MTQALELAHKGAGWVNPNPLVGTVVVRDGEILAAGYHDRYRGPHAERMAFDYADEHGIDMHGATVIDTLEPCCHVGSQPACTDLILSHGITRVVVGSIDPNPIVAGKGLRILEENGVEVVYDVMRAECDAINRHFFHYITQEWGCGRNVDKSTFLDPFSYLTNDLTIAIMCFVNRRHKFRKEDDS